MNYHIINYEHRGFDQSPVKVNIILGDTRTPAIFAVGNFSLIKPDTKFFSIKVDTRKYLLFCRLNVPILKDLAAIFC